MRVKKEIYYAKEQKEILEKILNILEIDENNKTFLLYELDNDKEKQEKILELKDDIHKYFTACKWGVFNTSIPKSEREYLLLLRNVIKSMNINMIGGRYTIKRNDNKIATQKYLIAI